MARVKIKISFNRSWPLAGLIRKEGEILVEGFSEIEGITADKIINAFMNDAVKVELGPAKDAAGEKKTNRHRHSAVPRK